MKLPRYLMPAILIAPMACALIAAPPALADCYSSGDSQLCSQGNIRGGQGRAPVNRSANPLAPQACRFSCNDSLFPQTAFKPS
jgi:hypothetical protein